MNVYGRVREGRLHRLWKKSLSRFCQRGSVQHVCNHRLLAQKKNPQPPLKTRSCGFSQGMEAAGIEPASESLQLQPLHMLFRGQNSHPSNLPGRTRGVLAWFKFRQLLLQAWEKGGYPTS